MLKKELVDAIYNRVNAEYIESNKLKSIVLTKGRIEEVADAIFEEIKEAVANGKKVKIVGHGTYGVRERSERPGHNPKTKEKLIIPASKTPYFKACEEFKKRVNNGINGGNE